MDLTTIRTRVRTLLDLDAEDLSDDFIDQWAREATYRIHGQVNRMPYFESDWTFSTTASDAVYTFSDIGTDVNFVTHVRGSDRELVEIDQQSADRKYQRNTSSYGRPLFYVVKYDSIVLYPTPSETESMLVRGYRDVEDWVADGAGAEPDFPTPFHNTVYLWCVSRAYMAQEDEQLGMHYFDLFQNELDLLANRAAARPAQQPVVMGGGNRSLDQTIPYQLRYPFD